MRVRKWIIKTFTTLQSAGTRFTDNAYMYLLANYLKHQSTCSLIIDNIDLLVVIDLIYVHFHLMMNQTSSMVRSDTKTIISQKYKQISLRCVIYIDCGVAWRYFIAERYHRFIFLLACIDRWKEYNWLVSAYAVKTAVEVKRQCVLISKTRHSGFVGLLRFSPSFCLRAPQVIRPI